MVVPDVKYFPNIGAIFSSQIGQYLSEDVSNKYYVDRSKITLPVLLY